MNKKIVTLILITLISFSYLGIATAVTITLDDNDTSAHDNTIDTDKNVDTNKNDDTDKKSGHGPK